MLARRLRRWANIKTTLNKRPVFDCDPLSEVDGNDTMLLYKTVK